jgi:hypothetical protein
LSAEILQAMAMAMAMAKGSGKMMEKEEDQEKLGHGQKTGEGGYFCKFG